jgi:ketosteroid isomerase-like protein
MQSIALTSSLSVSRRSTQPSANLDLVRSIYADWERGDYGSTDWAHPEMEYVIADGPSPGVWRGPAEMANGTRELLSAWDDWRGEAEEYRELDDERVLVLTRFRGRGKASGVALGEIGATGASLWHVRDDRVQRLVTYFNRDRALADLGLVPEGGSQR